MNQLNVLCFFKFHVSIINPSPQWSNPFKFFNKIL